MKEATAARPVAKVEGILALVEEAKVELKYLSSPVYMSKLNADYLETLIQFK